MKDVERFVELLKTDEGLRERMTAAAGDYTGEKTQDALFQNLVLPAAKEAGCDFTREEYESYVSSMAKTLDPDEMDQVAGGRGGAGVVSCIKVGVGFGSVQDDDGQRTVCLIVGGGGEGIGICMSDGWGC